MDSERSNALLKEVKCPFLINESVNVHELEGEFQIIHDNCFELKQGGFLLRFEVMGEIVKSLTINHIPSIRANLINLKQIEKAEAVIEPEEADQIKEKLLGKWIGFSASRWPSTS